MSETLRTVLRTVKETAEYTQPAFNQVGVFFNYIDKKTEDAIKAGEQKTATDLEKGLATVLSAGKGIIPTSDQRTASINYVQSKYEEYSNDFNEVFGCNNDQQESQTAGENAADAHDL